MNTKTNTGRGFGRSGQRVGAHTLSLTMGAAIAALAGLAVSPATAAGVSDDGLAHLVSGVQTGDMDVLVIRQGSSWQEVQGKLISETDTEIVFEVINLGLKARTTFRKADVIEIRRAAETNDAPAAETPRARRGAANTATPGTADDGRVTVYVMDVVGDFGVDVAVTPLREAVHDAKQYLPDILVVSLDTNWTDGNSEVPDDAGGEFDRIFLARDIAPIFTYEIQTEWPRDKQPRVVMWVKNAMGGSAFIPLSFKEIYFHPEARMGGLGNLMFMFSNVDALVKAKLTSASLGSAKGLANLGGHDELLVDALARLNERIAVSWEGGVPRLYRGTAVGNDEQLTDDGTNPAEADSLRDRVTGRGNDVLTLRADMALKLGFSQGTAATEEELWQAMDLDRVGVREVGDGGEIMQRWSDAVYRASRELPRLQQEFQDIQVGGDYRQRSRARAMQIDTLKKMQRLVRAYGESLAYVFQGRVPSEEQIRNQIDEIEQQQRRDRG